MFALSVTSDTHVMSRNDAAAKANDDELADLAEKKGAPYWKALGIMNQGALFSLVGKSSEAVDTITSGISLYRSTGSTFLFPWYSSFLAIAYAELGQLDDAWRCASEAITTVEATKERWCEAEVCRMAGEITLLEQKPDCAKAQQYFERAIEVARKQQAKSWELRASMSLARLWRDQGKVQQARELLAPVYGWFTEGFDTLDLKEAKALLTELA
jgi:predicted ATPase